jgi:hypothetical protein
VEQLADQRLDPAQRPSGPPPPADRPFGDPQVPRDLADAVAAGEPPAGLQPQPLPPLLFGGRVPATLRIPHIPVIRRQPPDIDPHAGAIPWPGPSVTSITQPVDLGPFEDASACLVMFARLHGIFGGTTGSGKSG